MYMMLEMTYFCAELVQLIVSRSDSELEMQRYGMKKNTLTVHPIMLQDELWMRQCEKPSPNRRSRFIENRTAETEFSVFDFWGRFGSVRFLENWYPKFSSDSAHPYLTYRWPTKRRLQTRPTPLLGLIHCQCNWTDGRMSCRHSAVTRSLVSLNPLAV